MSRITVSSRRALASFAAALTGGLAAAMITLLSVSQMVWAPDAISAPAQKQIGSHKTEMVPSLIVMNAKGASLQDGTLTLTGVAPNSIVFADRPVRAAGHALTTHLLEEWTPAADSSDSFAKDPPNATVSVFSKDGAKVTDAVVVLKSPKLDGDRLTFAVDLLEGDLAGAAGPASVFIDIIGRPLTPLSFSGVERLPPIVGHGTPRGRRREPQQWVQQQHRTIMDGRLAAITPIRLVTKSAKAFNSVSGVKT